MFAGFVVVLLLGGIGAALLGTGVSGGFGTVLIALGAAAFGAALVLIGIRLSEQESSRK